jgi:hypothetical protein
VKERAKELVEELLKERCDRLSAEEKDRKVLFFCGDELVGSVIPLDEGKLALTVYSPKLSDSVHREFLAKSKEVFGNKLIEGATKLSSGVEQNFYYTYVHVKL